MSKSQNITANDLIKSFKKQAEDRREWLKQNKPKAYKKDLTNILNKRLSDNQIYFLIRLLKNESEELNIKYNLDTLFGRLALEGAINKTANIHGVKVKARVKARQLTEGATVRILFYEGEHLTHPDVN